MERCDGQALINTRPALQWSKTYSRSIASRVARCNVDVVGEALQHIRTAKIQRKQPQRPLNTISALPSARWSGHCVGRRLEFFDHTGDAVAERLLA